MRKEGRKKGGWEERMSLVPFLVTCILSVYNKMGVIFQDGACEVYICESKILTGHNLCYHDFMMHMVWDGKIYS